MQPFQKAAEMTRMWTAFRSSPESTREGDTSSKTVVCPRDSFSVTVLPPPPVELCFRFRCSSILVPAVLFGDKTSVNLSESTSLYT